MEEHDVTKCIHGPDCPACKRARARPSHKHAGSVRLRCTGTADGQCNHGPHGQPVQLRSTRNQALNFLKRQSFVCTCGGTLYCPEIGAEVEAEFQRKKLHEVREQKPRKVTQTDAIDHLEKLMAGTISTTTVEVEPEPEPEPEPKAQEPSTSGPTDLLDEIKRMIGGQ